MRHLGYLCYNLVVAWFCLLVPAKWLVGKTGFCTSQVIGGEVYLRNDLYNVLSKTLSL